jgi:hypothetical protein
MECQASCKLECSSIVDSLNYCESCGLCEDDAMNKCHRENCMDARGNEGM